MTPDRMPLCLDVFTKYDGKLLEGSKRSDGQRGLLLVRKRKENNN